MKHRGRIQVQGEYLETSKTWSQNKPIAKDTGLRMLEDLISEIPKRESQIRKKAFNKAIQFIK